MDKVSLGSPSWPKICNPPASVPQSLGLIGVCCHTWKKSFDSEEVGRERNVLGIVPKRI